MIPTFIQELAITASKDPDIIPILCDALLELEKDGIVDHLKDDTLHRDGDFGFCETLETLAVGKWTARKNWWIRGRRHTQDYKELESWLGPNDVK